MEMAEPIITNLTVLLKKSEEEQFAEVFNDIGPFIAIGKPGEKSPPFGASRLYITNDKWKQTVSILMKKAKLVVFRISSTSGYIWEVKKASTLLYPEKYIFLIPNDIDYNQFAREIELLFPTRMPKKPQSWPSAMGTIYGIVSFSSNWDAQLLYPTKINAYRRRFFNPIVPVLKTTLKPLYDQLGVNWIMPPINLATILSHLLVFFMIISFITMVLHIIH